MLEVFGLSFCYLLLAEQKEQAKLNFIGWHWTNGKQTLRAKPKNSGRNFAAVVSAALRTIHTPSQGLRHPFGPRDVLTLCQFSKPVSIKNVSAQHLAN